MWTEDGEKQVVLFIKASPLPHMPAWMDTDQQMHPQALAQTHHRPFNRHNLNPLTRANYCAACFTQCFRANFNFSPPHSPLPSSVCAWLSVPLKQTDSLDSIDHCHVILMSVVTLFHCSLAEIKETGWCCLIPRPELLSGGMKSAESSHTVGGISTKELHPLCVEVRRSRFLHFVLIHPFICHKKWKWKRLVTAAAVSTWKGGVGYRGMERKQQD